jgi:predicted GNAT family acetyltransferase
VELNLNEVAVTHNEAAHRFEAQVGELHAFMDYRRFPDHIVLTHTEVPLPVEGHGLAGKLTSTALDFARAGHLRVVPLCPYVASFISKHPEYNDLLSTEDLRQLKTRSKAFTDKQSPP